VVGVARRDDRWEEPESDPPGRELRPSSQGLGRERDTVVGADAAGPAALSKYAGEDRCGLVPRGGGEGLAGQPETTVALDHGEGLAVAAVAGVAVACHVSGPELVGRAPGGGRFPRRAEASAPALAGPQPVSAQDRAAAVW
jgi:hypothetical protein